MKIGNPFSFTDVCRENAFAHSPNLLIPYIEASTNTNPMCKVSGELKLCTCAAREALRAKHHWVLYRWNEQHAMIVIGEIFLPVGVDFERDEYNREVLLQWVNRPGIFDTEIQIGPRDRLMLWFTIGKDNWMTYGFEFNGEMWETKVFDSFGWEYQYEKEVYGKIENALKRR